MTNKTERDEIREELQGLLYIHQNITQATDAILKVKRRYEVERIKRIIVDKELMPTVCEDSWQAEWSEGEARKLAEAIVEGLNKG